MWHLKEHLPLDSVIRRQVAKLDSFFREPENPNTFVNSLDERSFRYRAGQGQHSYPSDGLLVWEFVISVLFFLSWEPTSCPTSEHSLAPSLDPYSERTLTAVPPLKDRDEGL